jgi:hypothetical protein
MWPGELAECAGRRGTGELARFLPPDLTIGGGVIAHADLAAAVSAADPPAKRPEEIHARRAAQLEALSAKAKD